MKGPNNTAGGHLASLNWIIQSFESTHTLGHKITLTIATLSTAILLLFLFSVYCCGLDFVFKRRHFINYLPLPIIFPNNIPELPSLLQPVSVQFYLMSSICTCIYVVLFSLQNWARTRTWLSLSCTITKMSNHKIQGSSRSLWYSVSLKTRLCLYNPVVE